MTFLDELAFGKVDFDDLAIDPAADSNRIERGYGPKTVEVHRQVTLARGRNNDRQGLIGHAHSSARATRTGRGDATWVARLNSPGSEVPDPCRCHNDHQPPNPPALSPLSLRVIGIRPRPSDFGCLG